MTTIKPRKRQRKAVVLAMLPPHKQEIDQADIAPIVGRYNALRGLVQDLCEEADDILERLQNGVRVEPGIHTADIEVRCERGRYTEVLMIDGHELVLPEFPRVSA